MIRKTSCTPCRRYFRDRLPSYAFREEYRSSWEKVGESPGDNGR